MRRRTFIQLAGGAAGSLLLPNPVRAARRTLSANDKLNIAVIGVANQGRYNLDNVASENIVALCDVDEKFLAAARQKYTNTRPYHDFREMLDKEKELDAVVVATPDHTHAVATVAALKRDLHVYCEKPLTKTVSEARIVTNLAKDRKAITQIGTQIHAGENYRRVVELIQGDAIGPVKEVHVWAGASYGNKKLPTDHPPVPEHLHYDLWLGPAQNRPYHPEWVPFNWRNWWAFGGGALADFGCHFMDLPHWALDLTYPKTIEAEGPPVNPETPPPTLTVRYTYPARGSKPPVNLTWYHGGKYPTELVSAELYSKWRSGVLFIGEKGQLLADYGRRQLLPEAQFADFKAPEPTILNSIGHHKEWIQAIKAGKQPTCHFGYSGPLTESVLLGNVAYRVGKKLEWDAKNLKARNCPEAVEFIQHKYRQGWSI